VKGGKGPPVRPLARPELARDRVERRRSIQKIEVMFAQLLPHEHGQN